MSTTLHPSAGPAPGPADREYTVRQASEMTGLSEHTLRYYERARLLDPVRREHSSRHRRYTVEDIARLQTLACLRAAGVPLDQMRRYFELMELGASAAPLQHAMLSKQRQVLEARLAELMAHIDYLDRKLDYWSAVEAGDTERAAAIAAAIFRSFDCSDTPRHP
jgi:MerR family transcriptional regulator, aldehyde-responsive regulator